jgi:hypothetical protein
MAKVVRAANDPREPRVMSGEIWSELCDTLRQSEALVLVDDLPATPALRADGLRYLTRYFAGGARLCVELANPDYPELGRMVDTTLSWGVDNPDCIYLYAAIRGDATYRISGHRGTAHHFDVQVNRGHFAQSPEFSLVSTRSAGELALADDGSVEMILSPDEHLGNWLRLEPDASWILVRQYFNDWENERPADLVIEREGASYPPPPLQTDQIAERFDRLKTWFEVGGRYWDEMARFSLDRGPNEIYFRPLDETSWGGLRGLAYGFGNFRCEPGEAVIIEVTPPPCHYWSFSLANRYWETLEWNRRQTSLNGHQARLDSDGAFRAVISHEDPGVPNWLDPAGHSVGTIMGRYLLTDAAPQPTHHRVAFADLRAALPPDTPPISPQERSEILRRRQRAVALRNRH